MSRPDLRSIAARFRIEGDFLFAEPYGTGHINDTYCAVFRQATAHVRYILQRINHNVFKNPVLVMENIGRVTSHLAAKLEGTPDAGRRALTLIPTGDGTAWHHDAAGNCWRAYVFIERARSYDTIESPGQAFEAARAFGRFQGLLADLPPPRLHETIPDFHYTPRRFAAFEAALQADGANRAVLAQREIQFALSRRATASLLIDANLPERVTHNDTKLNNVMLDDATGEGVCVIDLDTVMPGSALYDFGDMVRTSTSPAPEDERDLSRVGLKREMFEALVRGYLSSAGGFLTPEEVSLLTAAGRVITFESGLRFLADFLAGDVYFKVHREHHNLDRCRTQFALVESIEKQEAAMNRLVDTVARSGPTD